MRYEYSVTSEEIGKFVGGNPPVASWLRKYRNNSETWKSRARYLCMFFKWLRVEKDLEVSPEEFLRVLDQKRQQHGVSKVWGKNLALEFSRDNPEFEGKSVSYRFGTVFTTVKRFCDDNEVPLTSAKAVFGEKIRRKFDEPPFTVEHARKALAILNQRDRAACMVMLQSGQSIKQTLVDINGQAERVFREIDEGKKRIRFDFRERKGNGFSYFSFISVDAIQELCKWRVERERILREHRMESPWLFINEQTCKPLSIGGFKFNFRDLMRRHGLWTGPYTVRPHMFRKIFEGEASPPDRGISKLYVKFMLGHAVDEVTRDKLDVAGGVYDKKGFANPEVVEREYEKLEPYINIYSGKPPEGEGLGLSEDELSNLRWLLQKIKENKVVIKE